mmetsp:Transcript_18161/g.41524  ORF Transcript_18161/g.41524 Transcript_18161/m.41524 type:complete len:243 (-) Transcript_18161:797-1525(-)
MKSCSSPTSTHRAPTPLSRIRSPCSAADGSNRATRGHRARTSHAESSSPKSRGPAASPPAGAGGGRGRKSGLGSSGWKTSTPPPWKAAARATASWAAAEEAPGPKRPSSWASAAVASRGEATPMKVFTEPPRRPARALAAGARLGGGTTWAKTARTTTDRLASPGGVSSSPVASEAWLLAACSAASTRSRSAKLTTLAKVLGESTTAVESSAAAATESASSLPATSAWASAGVAGGEESSTA